MGNEQETAKKKTSWKRETFEWVYTIIIAVTAALLIKTFVLDFVRVDGSSMIHTLEDNDKLIITKLGYEPAQGDIIILDSNYKDREEYYDLLAASEGEEELDLFSKIKLRFTMPEELKPKYYVKRIIALPGQTVDIHDNKVYVDGQPLDEPYCTGITTKRDSTVEFPQVVEEDCLFVMGDNRENSQDSRSSQLGQVPYEAVMGKSQIRIMPFDKIGFTR